MGNKFLALRKSEFAKVAPDRAALMGKVSQEMADMKTIREADERWQQKKHEQRNREAMEQNGYTEESCEEWKENDMRTELFAERMEELAEKRMLLGVRQDAMDSLLPEERELAMKVFGEKMPLADYAYMKGKNPRMLSDHKRKVLSKLRKFFTEHGFEMDSR